MTRGERIPPPSLRQYPAEGTEKEVGPRTRKLRFYQVEAETLGRGRREPAEVPVPARETGRMMHGRLIQPGTRPYVRAPIGWMPALTERQKRRRRLCRTARSWGRMLKLLENTPMTMAEFVEGLTDEELVRGKLRDTNGQFRGRNPTWVPREFHRACIRELMRRGQALWRKNYLEAIETLTEIAVDPEADPRDRMKAAMYVIERIEGKVPEKVEVTIEEEPWRAVIEEIVADVPDEAIARARSGAREATEIIEAEVVSEEMEDEPEPPRPRRAARSVRKR